MLVEPLRALLDFLAQVGHVAGGRLQRGVDLVLRLLAPLVQLLQRLLHLLQDAGHLFAHRGRAGGERVELVARVADLRFEMAFGLVELVGHRAQRGRRLLRLRVKGLREIAGGAHHLLDVLDGFAGVLGQVLGAPRRLFEEFVQLGHVLSSLPVSLDRFRPARIPM